MRGAVSGSDRAVAGDLARPARPGWLRLRAAAAAAPEPAPRSRRQARHSREHGADQCLRRADDVCVTANQRQDQDPRLQLTGEVPDLADLPAGQRSSGGEGEDGPVAELGSWLPPGSASAGGTARARAAGSPTPARPVGPGGLSGVGQDGSVSAIGCSSSCAVRPSAVRSRIVSTAIGVPSGSDSKSRSGVRGSAGSALTGRSRVIGQGTGCHRPVARTRPTAAASASSHEAGQRRERAGQQQLEIAKLIRGERAGRQGAELGRGHGLSLSGHDLLQRALSSIPPSRACPRLLVIGHEARAGNTCTHRLQYSRRRSCQGRTLANWSSGLRMT